METRLVGTNHIPSPLAEDESRPVVFNRELRDVSVPREANSLGPERPVFLTDVPTDVPAEARPEDENSVQVAALADLPEREKRRLRHDPAEVAAVAQQRPKLQVLIKDNCQPAFGGSESGPHPSGRHQPGGTSGYSCMGRIRWTSWTKRNRRAVSQRRYFCVSRYHRVLRSPHGGSDGAWPSRCCCGYSRQPGNVRGRCYLFQPARTGPPGPGDSPRGIGPTTSTEVGPGGSTARANNIHVGHTSPANPGNR